MINETVNYTLHFVDLGVKSSSCMHNNMISDTCLYNVLCKPLNEYFIYTGLILIIGDLLLLIIQFLYKSKCKNDTLKLYKFLFTTENLMKFALIIFCIVTVYYNIM
jgi:hypothetical protein